ncbi:MAG: hypothetical protein AB1546_01865, partial [bacterium]
IMFQPFLKFKSLNLNMLREDYPGQQTSGTTRVKMTNLSGVVTASKALQIKPNFIQTLTAVTGSTSVEVSNFALGFDYRPALRPFEIFLQLEWGKEDKSDLQDSTTNKYLTDVKYEFSSKTEFIVKFNRYTRTTGGSEDSNQIISYQYNYMPTEKWKAGLKLEQTSNQTSSSSSDKNNTYLTSDYKLSKVLRWLVDYRLTKFSSSPSATDSHNGKILETQLKAEFK